ncbi:sialidase family protein [Planctomycetota bacterium]
MKKVILVTVLVLFTSLGCNKLDKALLRTEQIEPVKDVAYVYATFEMGSVNPIAGNLPKYPQVVSVGEKTGDVFVPAVRFGLGDDNRADGTAKMTGWASDGSINYFGPFMRPDTPYDFKIKLDMNAGKMTIWVSGRGDDDWFMLAENKPLINPVTSINHVEITEDYPASVIDSVMVRGSQWAQGEQVRPHPLAKADKVVLPGAGFEFRSMRSTWRKPGKHVTIFREEGFHAGFPDVAQAGPNHLVCVWRNSSHTGGTARSSSISHSYDLGQTWTPPVATPTNFGGHVPRLRRLSDGSLVMLDDWGGAKCSDCGVVFFDSTDGGNTWTNERKLNVAVAGGTASSCPSRITELSDGSWLIANSRVDYEGPIPIWVEIFRSTDRGQSWAFWSDLKAAYQPHGTDESSIVELLDGRLLIFTRGSRGDNMPSVRAFSSDKGLTWDWFESPFQVSGRTCAGLLSDGRALVTYRSGIGRAALWGWVGDPNDMTGFQISAGHFNDHESVGLKDGALHIDNDGRRGQFTMYNMRPPDTGGCVVDVTAEVKVLRNDGYAATLSVPFAGKLRIFPDHIVTAHDPAVRVDVTPGVFHTYRIMSQVGRMRLYVDGVLEFDGDYGDDRVKSKNSNPTETSVFTSYYSLAFGNEQCGSGTTEGDVMSSGPDVYLRHISPDTTGYSIWKRVEEVLDDPTTGHREYSWVASRDGFPDEYQMDHIIEIDASVSGHDQGYSGWIQLDDGRIFVAHYSDDTADASMSPYHNMGVPWIRGTFLELSDLPPATATGP